MEECPSAREYPIVNSNATRRFRAKREVILDVAARHFNQHGIRGGTLAEVARVVGLATNSLTYYYPKKEDLASACLLRSIETMSALCAQAAQHSRVADRVRAFIGGYVRMLADIGLGKHPERAVFNEVRSLTPPHSDSVGTAYTDMFRKVRMLLRPLADEDGGRERSREIDRQALNARAHLLLSLTTWTRAWFDRYELQDYEQAGERMADIIVNGLAAPGVRWDSQATVMPWLASPVSGSTQDAFLRAATREVNDHGYRGASVDRISAQLHLTKGAFYHHHETKHELISACFERTFEAMRTIQAAAAGSPGTGWQRLQRACCGLVAYQLSEHGPLLRVSAWSALPEAMRHGMQRTMTRVGERFGALIVDGMADGSLRICDQSIAAQLVNGMINAAAEIEHWVPGLTPDNAARLFVAPMLCGLAPPIAAMSGAVVRTGTRG